LVVKRCEQTYDWEEKERQTKTIAEKQENWREKNEIMTPARGFLFSAFIAQLLGACKKAARHSYV
jgi:hypothetical protein